MSFVAFLSTKDPRLSMAGTMGTSVRYVINSTRERQLAGKIKLLQIITGCDMALFEKKEELVFIAKNKALYVGDGYFGGVSGRNALDQCHR